MAGKPTHDERLDQYLRDTPERAVGCRDLGHSWIPWSAARLPGGSFTRRLRCERCTSEREQVLSRYGEIISSHYVYADGYVWKGYGRMTADDRSYLRLGQIEVLIERAGEAGNAGTDLDRTVRFVRQHSDG